ncbi:MAG: histidine kinase [Gemmatimonadaceae bacterium]
MHKVPPQVRLFLVLIWILPAAVSVIGVYLVSPLYNQGMTLGEAFIAYLLAWITWALWVPVILWLGDRVPLDRTRWPLALGAHIIGSFIVGGIQVFVFMYVLRAFRLFDPSFSPSSLFAVGMRYFAGQMLVVYWAIVCAHAAIRLFGEYRAQALVAARLESDLVNAQLHALRSQLNPHFLFNALNSVVTLIGRDTAGAQKMVVTLSELLRATLAAGDASEVLLRQELELVERYLDLEAIRFGDRLHIVFDVEPGLSFAKVPALVLQPLVENAIVHGVSQLNERGRVVVRVRGRDGILHLEVQDNGPGPMSKPRRPGSGIGLANLRARVERLYGNDFGVTLESVPTGGCLVAVTLPLVLPTQQAGAA